jgi:putative ABC transport system substrate-binding protein
MRIKTLGVLVTLALAPLVAPIASEAQQPGKVPRIGYLSSGTATSALYAAFRQGLRELGYVEGQNIAIEYRYAEGRPQLVELSTDLVRLKVDVIVAELAASYAAKLSTPAIPIVFGFSGDPVEAGFVPNLARPGGNMTGITFLALELVGKRLELLKEAASGISRVAVLASPAHPGEQRELMATQAAAQTLGVSLQYLPISASSDFDRAFETITSARAKAVLAFPDALTMAHRNQIAEFALKRRLPSVFGWREYVEAGGLMSYGPNLSDSFRRITSYVDKILKGAKPADLPVEQPMKFELVLNLKTAKALGLTIPPSIMVRADQVIQ